jgi:hypothetical protein
MRRKKGRVLVLIATVTLALVLTAPCFAQEKSKPAAPSKETAPAKEMMPAKEKGEFAIARAVVGTGVENREPVGAAETFPGSTEKVYCFIEATNIPRDMELTTVWSMGDKDMRKINASVKAGAKWRTWVEKNVSRMKGDWKVEIKDTDGKTLKEMKFKVE